MSDTIHLESFGHWDRDQISALLHERDALAGRQYRAFADIVQMTFGEEP